MAHKCLKLLCFHLLLGASFSASGEWVHPVIINKAQTIRDCGPNVERYVVKDKYSCGSLDGYSPLLVAAIINDVEYLRSRKRSELEALARSPEAIEIIGHAASADSQEFLRVFLEEHLEIESLKDVRWRVLLDSAGLTKNQHPIFDAIASGSIGVLDYFFRTGVSFGLTDSNGLSADLVALTYKQERVLAFLRGVGVVPNCDFMFPNGRPVVDVAKSMGLLEYFSSCGRKQPATTPKSPG